MPKSDFSHVTTWVFDLDNTLYHPSMGLFAQMNPKMSAYIMQVAGVNATEADELRNRYWREYGTTMAGLIEVHGMDPDAFLKDVHDINLSHLQIDPPLAKAIAALPGRKIVYTNGTAPYARRVLAARGIDAVFDAVYGVENAGYQPKPRAAAFEAIFAQAQVDPTQSAMFEDEERNLAVPHDLGMRTVHVADTAIPQPYIGHHTPDLTGFLSQLV
jgi:putative hydrolase of the HAD superfamily